MPGVTLALIFAFGWVPLHCFRAEGVRAALPLYGRGERVWVLLSIVLLTGHISAACVTLSLQPTIPIGRATVGIGVFAAGIGFWLWGRTQVGPLRRARLPDELPTELRRDGAFGLVRHPLYCGVLVATGAPVLASGRSFLTLTYMLCVLAVTVRCRQEERRLLAQLGPTYAAYCREVKRLIPFVW